MHEDALIESSIERAVKSGTLPSSVFRRLLSEYPTLGKRSLGVHFRAAYPKVDSIVWSIVASWQESRKDEYFDLWIDLLLIKQLLLAEYDVPWSYDWVEEQWSRIKPFVGSSTTT